MPDKMAWSINAGSSSGSIDASGSLDTESVMASKVTIDAASNKALALQLDVVTKLNFFALKSSLGDGKVTIKAGGAGAKDIVLNGPLVLFGPAVGLLGASLETLTVTNAHATLPADIEILIGHKLTP
jgi:hypothetical protein